MEPLAVDLREAAQLLSVSARTIRRLVDQGRLPVVHVGRRVVIPLASVRELLLEPSLKQPHSDVHVAQEQEAHK